MKIKRSERLIDMTYYLLENPFKIVPLSYFSEEFETAKSSISEDLAIIKKRFEAGGIGELETIAGATGGAKFIPKMKAEDQWQVVGELIEELDNSERLLPGGFVYLTDIISQPTWLKKIGRVIAAEYLDKEIDTVMTVATSGTPIAQSVAAYLNIPFTIVSRDPKVTEGSTVSINYVSGSSNQRVEKMELSRRSLKSGSRVLVVDDFVKSGGTIEGMESLLQEFNAELVGAAVVAENLYEENRTSDLYKSLIKIKNTDSSTQTIEVERGDFLADETGRG